MRAETGQIQQPPAASLTHWFEGLKELIKRLPIFMSADFYGNHRKSMPHVIWTNLYSIYVY